MPTIEGLDPTLQTIVTAIFAIAVAVFSAFSYVRGKKPAETQTTKEFALSGQLADMGPVKELVEQAGLLVQQQVRTNMHLEATAKALREAADLIAAHLSDLRQERAENEADEVAAERAQAIAEKVIEAMKPKRRPRAKSPARRATKPPAS